MMENQNQISEMLNNNTKIVDGILGLAIGDAIGVPAEFKSREELKRNPITNMIGYGTHNQPIGTWSDDSSMTIATIDSINECGKVDYYDIMNKFVDWENKSEYTATGIFFDIGITTSKALSNFKLGLNPLECGETAINANGNGSLMRILPIALYSYYNNLSDDKEVELINNCSSLTHAHEISCLGCKIYCDYIKLLLDGNTPEQAYRSMSMEKYRDNYSSQSLNYYKRIFDGSLLTAQEKDISSSGFVVSTLEASIWVNLHSNNYQEAILKAVNLGDDTDTVGAVAGSISGIVYGYEKIPNNWKENLKRKDYLIELCNKFEKTITNNEDNKNKIL